MDVNNGERQILQCVPFIGNHFLDELGWIFKLNEYYVVDKLIGWLHYFILNVQII